MKKMELDQMISLEGGGNIWKCLGTTVTGFALGAAEGAAIGSFFAPGGGTLVGLVLGGYTGGVAAGLANPNCSL